MSSVADIGLVTNTFKGAFLTEPQALLEKLSRVKAYVFDWDGVFNSGRKDADGSSPFNEIDSMGVNMLRFNHYLRKNCNPVTAIITGENNPASFTLAKREHFHGVYYNVKHKIDALQHLCHVHDIEPRDVAFFFDDITDLSVAGVCGLRIMVSCASKPLLHALVHNNNLADYITAADGDDQALREAAELLMGLSGQYDDTILQRVHYTDNYRTYITFRNAAVPAFYTSIDSRITEQFRP